MWISGMFMNQQSAGSQDWLIRLFLSVHCSNLRIYPVLHLRPLHRITPDHTSNDFRYYLALHFAQRDHKLHSTPHNLLSCRVLQEILTCPPVVKRWHNETWCPHSVSYLAVIAPHLQVFVNNNAHILRVLCVPFLYPNIFQLAPRPVRASPKFGKYLRRIFLFIQCIKPCVL